ncbi:hypothetical protein SAMN05216388_100585 [Halorientalis persicus]|jgi:hypothetical protein|uniref:DUF8119 domain-containing protein n=1 Tax=Halorientalis persicus TaxID=1367881 RepID=A0A1H8JH91_9EURY|nr:hypothetical protein [Halorientalis persicus]SEN80213.1 hypothetical protein SAMN05216388_100585 [Halorientalis persicus]
MSLVDSIRDHVREHRSGMVSDLLFALVWVTIVELFFRFVDGPQWAYYLFMLAGILAYFGFFWSLELARERQ